MLLFDSVFSVVIGPAPAKETLHPSRSEQLPATRGRRGIWQSWEGNADGLNGAKELARRLSDMIATNDRETERRLQERPIAGL